MKQLQRIFLLAMFFLIAFSTVSAQETEFGQDSIAEKWLRLDSLRDNAQPPYGSQICGKYFFRHETAGRAVIVFTISIKPTGQFLFHPFASNLTIVIGDRVDPPAVGVLRKADGRKVLALRISRSDYTDSPCLRGLTSKAGS